MSQNGIHFGRLYNLILIALFAALLALCSWIALPFFTLPITMQTFALFACIRILGARRAFYSVLLYLVLGLIGLPVFSGMTGGFAVLFGPGGGYLLGFLLLTLVVGGIEHLFPAWHLAPYFGMLLGLLLCYLSGTLWYMYVWAGTSEPMGFLAAVTVCVLPYILPDICKLILALIVSHAVKRHVLL